MEFLPALAKEAVENYVKTGKIIPVPAGFPSKFLTRRAGVFVTIEKKATLPGVGQKELALRGCIGTYLPTRDNIAKETIYNAISAAAEDWRFGPVRPNELADLFFTVSILSEPEPVIGKASLDAKKFGIIVKTDAQKCGLLLPDIEGVETPEQQIRICCKKGGIDYVRENPKLYRFTVEKYQ